MASSALRRSFSRRSSLRRALPPSPAPAATAAAGGASRRSFQSGDGETMDEFEQRLFGNSGVEEGSLYEKLDRVGNMRKRYGTGGSGGVGDRSTSGSMGGFGGYGDRSTSGSMGGFGGFRDRSNSESMGIFDSLDDGMSEMLGDAAHRFQIDEDDDEEESDEDFEFRPDVTFRRGSTYSVRDLDLTKPATVRNPPRPQFETSTAEVLRKADFRNVRFLSNFLTEAGIMIKRSQTRIGAKAQRKVAREIKTARAFGLMPFTTMGRKPFIFGRSAEEHFSDEEYVHNFVEQNDGESEEDDGDAADHDNGDAADPA